MSRLTAPTPNSADFVVASPEPVLVVEAREGGRIVAAYAAARTLFRCDEAAMRFAPLTSLLPNIVARSIVVALMLRLKRTLSSVLGHATLKR